MRLRFVTLVALVASLFPTSTFAQAAQEQSVPKLITVTGVFRPADGQAPGAVESVTLSVYAEQQGGAPVFQETQQVTLDDRGRYSVVLGAAHADGIPATVFASGAQWLGTVFERAGETEGPRTRLTSVPYAMRAVEADSLGGRPASDYQLSPSAGGSKAANATAADTGGVNSDVVLAGTPDFLAKYVNNADVGSSGVFESADGSIGLGTTTPFERLHVRFNNGTGDFTGLAVQNMNGGALAYSGMLFYDHTNALTQFQGYNNLTHEYRINNIARVSPGGAFNGSINFMLGGASKFIVAPNGNIGIGTTSPAALLEVSNVIPGGPANMWMTSYTNAVNPYYMARRARGTPAAPAAVQSGDGLAGFYGDGFGTSTFGSGFAGGMTVQAAQNWTDAARGTQINFSTTPNGSTVSSSRMVINNFGQVGIGTNFPGSNLEVSNATSGTTFGVVTATSFGNTNGASLFIGSKARGTSAAPTAVLANDSLGGFLGRGYGATTFGGTRGGMFVIASENWTDTAQGTSISFNTTPTGTTATGPSVTISPSGDLGIGTTFPQGAVEIVRQGNASRKFNATTYSGASKPGEFNFVTRAARGTPATPAAVQSGDELGGFNATGYGTTDFGNFGAGIGAFAMENWTDTAQGAALVLGTTPLGSSDGEINTIIMPGGNVGIGTFNAFPTITDKLQVFGDIRVGTAGTNGCLKNFAGTGIAGTCSSDRRLKKDITPFAPALDKVAALQPVTYFWRANEFPNRHFGNSRNYGLIAQDVEAVLPELVATESDGYKAVDYSELPLLTIQAVKELKAENDALKKRVDALEELQSENVALKQHLAEIERLLTNALGNAPRR